jgi:predicted enzyme related to lactoylglutathione lyase
MPPHWGLFVTVESADATASRAAALGGRVLQPVIDVFGIGYAAVIQDPTGAAIGLWEPGTHIGTGIAGENGTLCWADLNTLERQRARAFYEELFGWSFVTGKNKDSDGYLHIMNGKRGIGGILPESYRNKNAPPHWLPYFLAADCEASTTKAQELGGRVYVPPTTIENSLRFSVIADPQGAVFALFMPLH